jgi:hypothetical protein
VTTNREELSTFQASKFSRSLAKTMFFTLLMITATMLQLHKIRSLCSRLAKQIGNRASAVFYYVAGDDGTYDCGLHNPD